MIYLGIDFGTTNSCIYIAQDDFKDPKPIAKNADGSPLIMPSVICEKKEDVSTIRYYGNEALENIDADEKFFSNLKLSLRDKANNGIFTSNNGWQYYYKGKPLAGPAYNKKELTKDFIKQLLIKSGIKVKSGCIQWGGDKVNPLANTKIVMGCPVFNDKKQQDAYCDFFKDTLKGLGFSENSIEFVIEPCLAAYGLARSGDVIKEGDRILIFDCGGGTTDVSILEKGRNDSYAVIDCDGCNYAGVAIDKALFRYLRKESGQDYRMKFINNVFDGKTDINIKWLTSIRKLKEAACMAPNAIRNINKEIQYAKELGISDCLEFEFAKFYESEFWEEVIQKILQPLYKVIERANPTSTRNEIKNIYLAGGSSAMPKIQETIELILNEHKK